MATNGSRPTGRVVHQIPGRARVKLDRRELDPEMLVRIEQTVGSAPGIYECTVNRATGSLLLRYDEERVDLAQLVRLPEATSGTTGAGRARPGSDDKPEHLSAWAHAVNRWFGRLDKRLRVASEDRFDVKMVVPIAFGTLAIRQFIAQAGSLPTIPWYVVAWYAFDSYLKLHGHTMPAGQAIESLMDAAEQSSEGG